jgi:hypothetical protein
MQLRPRTLRRRVKVILENGSATDSDELSPIDSITGGAKLMYYDMTPESRNSGARADVHR